MKYLEEWLDERKVDEVECLVPDMNGIPRADFTYSPPVPNCGGICEVVGTQTTPNGNTVNRNLLDVSDWSYNLIGMYENEAFSARLAYNWRSGYLDLFAPRGDHLYIEEARPMGRLDVSASFNLSENFTLFADATNILKTPFRSTLTRLDGPQGGTESQFPRFVRFNESTVSAGARFRF